MFIITNDEHRSQVPGATSGFGRCQGKGGHGMARDSDGKGKYMTQ